MPAVPEDEQRRRAELGVAWLSSNGHEDEAAAIAELLRKLGNGLVAQQATIEHLYRTIRTLEARCAQAT